MGEIEGLNVGPRVGAGVGGGDGWPVVVGDTVGFGVAAKLGRGVFEGECVGLVVGATVTAPMEITVNPVKIAHTKTLLC